MLFSSISAIYAVNSKNIALNIQGNGQPDFVTGFKFALKVEAEAAGYEITENMSAAKYIIRFSVVFDQEEQKSKFTVTLIKVENSSEVITMEYFFLDEEEMLLYSQLVFFLLMANLPEEETAATVVEDDSWRNKWLYLRASFDYSFMYLALQPNGLIGGAGVYSGDYDSASGIAMLDNKIVPVPGIRLGAEVQFLDFMSVELGAQISLEEIVLKQKIYSALFSGQLKFPLKFFRGLIIEPYGAVAYPMRFPKENDVFVDFPMLAFGGGVQLAVKAGQNGAAFVDASYMYYGDTSMKNIYGPLYPNPEVIHYNHFVLGFSIGYKFGLFDRKKKSD